MSFSVDVKNEICTTVPKDCCVHAELYAQTIMGGSPCKQQGALCLEYTTENKAVAKRILGHLKKGYSLKAEVRVRKNALNQKNVYAVVVEDRLALYDALGISSQEEVPDDSRTINSCCKEAMLRGAFLARGSISDPQKDYHVEFVHSSRAFAEYLKKILSYYQIEAKIIIRKHNYVLYLNEGDGIISLLTLIGAPTAVLELENVRIYREMRNNVNRVVNCETANINKTVNAAITQMESIQTIDKHLGLETLTEPLLEAAQLRMDYPEATLKELCELGGITRSAMNHRLRKLNAIAKTLIREETQ